MLKGEAQQRKSPVYKSLYNNLLYMHRNGLNTSMTKDFESKGDSHNMSRTQSDNSEEKMIKSDAY